MAKRKPDRIDRAAAKIAEANLWPEKKRDRIAALVRREVRRAVKDERAAMRGAIVSSEGRWSDTTKRALTHWLDAREGR